MSDENNNVNIQLVSEDTEKPAELVLDSKKIDGYLEVVGRRKTSTARVRFSNAAKTSITINDKDASEYLKVAELVKIINEPFSKVEFPDTFKITVRVVGGGIHSQAEAIRHGIARALEKLYPPVRKTLKDYGFLKRDPRSKERRKFGLKKARKAPAWSKR
jgi:small subunit ribosomal protein S9